MSGFEDKLNSILSSPEAMAQVAALAQQLSGGGEPDAPAEGPPEPPPSPQAAPPPAGKGGLEDLLGALGGLGSGIDPAMLSKLLPLVQELSSPANDQRSALLHALRPFLKPERQDKVDQALRTAHMIAVGKKLLAHLGG